LARIVAREMGCTDPADLHEVDAAQYTGVDNVREIRSQASFKPTRSERRAWILDECHRMSPQAQDALLKLLEDTPRRSVFLLATTDPDKLLKTVRSRCAQFQVEPLDEEPLAHLLRNVARKERVRLPQEVAEQIARDSLGAVRDALMILEQVIALPPDKMGEAAQRMAAKQNQVIELCRVLMDSKVKWQTVAKILEGLKAEDPERVRRAVIGYCAAILRKQDNPKAFLVADEMERVAFLTTGWSGMVVLCYRVVQSTAT